MHPDLQALTVMFDKLIERRIYDFEPYIQRWARHQKQKPRARDHEPRA
jgi:hypothetical protein